MRGLGLAAFEVAVFVYCCVQITYVLLVPGVQQSIERHAAWWFLLPSPPQVNAPTYAQADPRFAATTDDTDSAASLGLHWDQDLEHGLGVSHPFSLTDAHCWMETTAAGVLSRELSRITRARMQSGDVAPADAALQVQTGATHDSSLRRPCGVECLLTDGGHWN